jgi:hypothetical protein
MSWTGDICIITNNGNGEDAGQFWLDEDVGKRIRVEDDRGGYVMARKLDGAPFNIRGILKDAGDIWKHNLQRCERPICGQCEQAMPYDREDYLCEDCRDG